MTYKHISSVLYCLAKAANAEVMSQACVCSEAALPEATCLNPSPRLSYTLEVGSDNVLCMHGDETR